MARSIKEDEKFDEAEAKRRFEAALRAGLPAKPHSEKKIGKPKAKPRKRKAVKTPR